MFATGGRPLRGIDGRRTRLRPATPDDLELLVGWFGDPETYRWWGGRPLPREEVRAKYTGIRPGVDSYVVETASEAGMAGQPIGYAQSWEDVAAPSDARRGIDLFVAPAFRRRGFGLDAARALVRHLIDEEGWRVVTVDPSAGNPAALAFWTRVGFRAVRDWPDHPDGPAVLLSIDRVVAEDE